MKRTVSLAIIFCMIIACLAGCGTKNVDTKKEETIVVDDLGRSVAVPKEINRIVVCSLWPLPSVLCCFFDSASKIVGVPENCLIAAKSSILGTLYPELLDAETSYTDGTDVNIEELMKLKPDVVFVNTTSPDIVAKLEEVGIPCVALSVNRRGYDCIKTLNDWTEILSTMFPENDKVEIVEEAQQEIYDLVHDRVKDIPEEERERVFFLFNYSETGLVTSGSSFFGQWWADSIGAKNVAEEITTDNQAPVNMEQVYAWNPSVIFVTNFTTAFPEDLYNNTVGNFDFSGIDAVKNKRVYKMPLGMYRSFTPGVDTPITLLKLAKDVYPNLFEDIDIISKTKEYYKDVFGIELTDEQANRIFNPDMEAGAIKK